MPWAIWSKPGRPASGPSWHGLRRVAQVLEVCRQSHCRARLVGGTRFYPKEASAPSFVVRPNRGAAVAFDGSVEHEGEAVVGGRRHVIVVFATEVDEDDRRPGIRAAQRRAAQSVFAAPPPSPRRHQRRAPRAASAYRSLF